MSGDWDANIADARRWVDIADLESLAQQRTTRGGTGMSVKRASAHRVTWHAAADGVAHAFVHRPGATPRYACGLLRHDERFDWPATFRCPVCEEVALADISR